MSLDTISTNSFLCSFLSFLFSRYISAQRRLGKFQIKLFVLYGNMLVQGHQVCLI